MRNSSGCSSKQPSSLPRGPNSRTTEAVSEPRMLGGKEQAERCKFPAAADPQRPTEDGGRRRDAAGCVRTAGELCRHYPCPRYAGCQTTIRVDSQGKRYPEI